MNKKFTTRLIGIFSGLMVLAPVSHATTVYSVTDLGTLGGNHSEAMGINASGQVVGWSTTVDGYTHAFVTIGGVITDLGTLPGYTNSVARGINNSGQVTGDVYTNDGYVNGLEHAFITNGGVMTDLGTLGDFRQRLYREGG